MGNKNVLAGIKYDKGKLDYSLLPIHSTQELVKCYMLGEKKYGRNNWRKGFKLLALFAAIMRHAFAWLGGEDRCPKDGQLHMTSVAWNANTIVELQESGKGEDDRWIENQNNKE